MKKQKTKFSVVNQKWIHQQMTINKISVEEIAAGLNTSQVQIHQWISGYRNPSKACVAAIYYFFTWGFREDRKVSKAKEANKNKK